MKKLALFPLIIVALSCGKEINTPTESSKNVFGNWKLHLLSGGFSGGIHEINEETTLELKPNGRATYTVGKKKTNCSFKLDISSTIHGSNQLTM